MRVHADNEEKAQDAVKEFMDGAKNPGNGLHIFRANEVQKPADFYDLEQRAREELNDRVNDMNDDERKEFFEEEHEVISEIADGLVPIYNSDLFEVAASNSDCWEDSEGLAGGSSDVLQILRSAIYSALCEELRNEFEGIKEKYACSECEDGIKTKEEDEMCAECQKAAKDA